MYENSPVQHSDSIKGKPHQSGAALQSGKKSQRDANNQIIYEKKVDSKLVLNTQNNNQGDQLRLAGNSETIDQKAKDLIGQPPMMQFNIQGAPQHV